MTKGLPATGLPATTFATALLAITSTFAFWLTGTSPALILSKATARWWVHHQGLRHLGCCNIVNWGIGVGAISLSLPPMNRIQPPNLPPPTTHLALNACEALRRPSLCEVRDLKDNDRQVHWAPGLFSGKQLPAAMCLELRKQKPLSAALGGLCLLCKKHMQRTRWEGGHAGTLWRQVSS